jgi:predicted Fe-Mo cluster-binding NifX family protein
MARSVVVVDAEPGSCQFGAPVTLNPCDLLENMHCLAGLQADVLICGAVSQQLSALLRAYEIRVVSFVSGDVHAVVDAYLRGGLGSPDFAMPGSRQREGPGESNTEPQERGER